MKGLLIALTLVLISFSAKTAGLTCPSGVGASNGDTPRILSKSDSVQLMVCGSEADGKFQGVGDHLSEFDVYSVSKDGAISNSLLTAGALDHYLVQKLQNGLRFDEMIYYLGQWTSAMRTDLTCRNGTCSFSKPQCVLKRRKSKSASKLDELRSFSKGKLRNQVPSEALILSVFDLAVSGQKDAQEIFLKNSGSFRLDGAAGEEFHRSFETLKKLREQKCI